MGWRYFVAGSDLGGHYNRLCNRISSSVFVAFCCDVVMGSPEDGNPGPVASGRDENLQRMGTRELSVAGDAHVNLNRFRWK